MNQEERHGKLALYYSHSWRDPDVDLNVKVWQEIAEACEVLVDAPETPGDDPPYYINRIEEYFRQTDLFLCVLTRREAPAGDGEGDGALCCSAYSLFEIRLAERFDLPRLVLYEHGTRFRAPLSPGPGEEYIEFTRSSPLSPVDQGFWDKAVVPKVRRWIEWARAHRRPKSPERQRLAVSLFPPDAKQAIAVGTQLEHALGDAGYERVAMRAAFRNNVELFRILRVTGLVVCEYGVENSISAQLAAVAHTLCIPAIRMVHGQAELPWLLQGHPGGYQQDLVTWTDPDELPALLRPRIGAMFRTTRALGRQEAHRYLESKRHGRRRIFISHTLKPPNRALVEHLVRLFGEQHVNAFEYQATNIAGVDWRAELDRHLAEATHFVVLLNDEYDGSQFCNYEIDKILERGNQVVLQQFMIHGRSKPHYKLSGTSHARLIQGDDPVASAKQIFEQVMQLSPRAPISLKR